MINKFNWLKVVRWVNRPWVNANYKNWVITLYDNWFKLSKIRQQSVLLHEHGHHIFYKLPRTYKIIWLLISNWKLIPILTAFWIISYKNNSYINTHSSKNYKEDFCEAIEFNYLREKWDKRKFNKCIEFKIKTAMSLYNKFQ